MYTVISMRGNLAFQLKKKQRHVLTSIWIGWIHWRDQNFCCWIETIIVILTIPLELDSIGKGERQQGRKDEWRRATWKCFKIRLQLLKMKSVTNLNRKKFKHDNYLRASSHGKVNDMDLKRAQTNRYILLDFEKKNFTKLL